MVGEAGCIGVMFFDPQIGFMVKQPIENIGGVPHTHVDDLRTERRVLVGDVSIKELAWLRSILWIDMAGAGSHRLVRRRLRYRPSKAEVASE